MLSLSRLPGEAYHYRQNSLTRHSLHLKVNSFVGLDNDDDDDDDADVLRCSAKRERGERKVWKSLSIKLKG